MRVPVSIVVRMNSASNMIAKWYQYFIRSAHARQAGEDLRHADRQRDRAARASGQRLAAPPLRARAASTTVMPSVANTAGDVLIAK